MRRPTALTLTAAAFATVASIAAAPPALADGKAQLGCSSPYTQATIAQIDAYSQPLVTAGFFTEDSLMALLVSLDHNGNGSLCYKTPPGWLGPPATNAAQRDGFLSLIDDKVIDS